MVQHILVAHDLSPEADLALRRGAQLARQSGARLSLLHVLDSRGENDETAARSYLQSRLQENGLGHLAPRLRQGRPAEEILAQARGLEADLLVLGRHHRDSPQGFAGTTLERILLTSPAPLLLAVNRDTGAYRRALAALDYSRCADRALRQAWQLLSVGATVLALHIHEVAEVHQPDAEELALQRELFEQLIGDLRATLADNGAHLDHGLRQGERSNCLESAIATERPQLLALGAHSRGEISSALLGSLSRQFLAQPPCDVLLVR